MNITERRQRNPRKSADPDSEYQQLVKERRESVRNSLTCACGNTISRFISPNPGRCCQCVNAEASNV